MMHDPVVEEKIEIGAFSGQHALDDVDSGSPQEGKAAPSMVGIRICGADNHTFQARQADRLATGSGAPRGAAWFQRHI